MRAIATAQITHLVMILLAVANIANKIFTPVYFSDAHL